MPIVYTSPVPIPSTPSSSSSPSTSPFSIFSTSKADHISSRGSDALSNAFSIPAPPATPSITVPSPTSFTLSSDLTQPDHPVHTIFVDAAKVSEYKRAVITIPPSLSSQECYISLQIQSNTGTWSPKQMHVTIGVGVAAGILSLAVLSWMVFMHWRMKYVLRNLQKRSPEDAQPDAPSPKCTSIVTPYDPLIRPSSPMRNYVTSTLLHGRTSSWVSALRNSTLRVEDSPVGTGRGCETPPPSYPAESVMAEEDVFLRSTPTTTAKSRYSFLPRIEIPSSPAAVKSPVLSLDTSMPSSCDTHAEIVSAVEAAVQPPAYCHIPHQ